MTDPIDRRYDPWEYDEDEPEPWFFRLDGGKIIRDRGNWRCLCSCGGTCRHLLLFRKTTGSEGERGIPVNDEKLTEGCARAIHGANTGWNVALHDPAPDAPSDALPEPQRDWILRRVQLIRDYQWVYTDDEDLARFIHQDWVDFMTARNWKQGKVKDPGAKPPTHPCLKDWRDCPPEQQVKDLMAISIVRSLCEKNQ